MNPSNPAGKYVPPHLRPGALAVPQRPGTPRRRSAPLTIIEPGGGHRSGPYLHVPASAPHARRPSFNGRPSSFSPSSHFPSSYHAPLTLAPPTPQHTRRFSVGAETAFASRPLLPLVGPVPPVVSPFGELDYDDALQPIRSALGRQGVHFVQLDALCIVVKTTHDVGPEWLAGRLAKEVGLRTPDMFIEREPCPALRELTGHAPHGVFLMSRVPGHSFAELDRRDLQDLRMLSPRGIQLFEELGHVAAFDYFISNFDRFPLGGLGGVNRGNAMITDDGVVVIDNTLPNPSQANSGGRRSVVESRVRCVLRACDPSAAVPEEAEDNLSRFADFFHQDAGLTWQRMREPVLTGFRRGAREVALLDPMEIRRMAKQCGDVPDAVQHVLLDHLRLFKNAHRDLD